MIKDSGERREFQSGAVRDIQEGKGRCDLLPLDVVSKWAESINDSSSLDKILHYINLYKNSYPRDTMLIYRAMNEFCADVSWSISDALLEVSIHYEEGAKKYGEYNWQKGIPSHCYLDSGIRHLLKHYRGDTDERHDRAFIWNMIGLVWNDFNKPEMNDVWKKEVRE